MRYTLPNNKTITIPDTDIQRTIQTMRVTQEEAVQIWLEDEGYEVNEEQQALEQKAKENRITATIHKAQAVKQKTQSERVKKPDPTKEGIVAGIAEMLPAYNATDVRIVNAGKLIEFKVGGEWFTVNLIRNTKRNKAEKVGK